MRRKKLKYQQQQKQQCGWKEGRNCNKRCNEMIQSGRSFQDNYGGRTESSVRSMHSL